MINFIKNWLECRRLYQTPEVQEFVQCLYDIDYRAWPAFKKSRANSYLQMLQDIHYGMRIGVDYQDIFQALLKDKELERNPYVNHIYLELQALFEGD